MKTKLLSFSIAVFVFVNCLGNGLDFCFGVEEAASAVTANQPIFQYSSLLCSIPVKIVNSLLNSKEIPVPACAKSSAKKQNKNNASSGVSLLARSGENLKTSLKLNCNQLPQYILLSLDRVSREAEGTHHPPGPPVELILFMMMLFVILPRSGISEVIIFYCRKD